jgi:uncharacterized membrane protein
MKKKKFNELKLASAIIETIFAIPIIGAMIILGFVWVPLIIALILHIVVLVLTIDTRNKTGSILGICASIFGFIPFVGWILHVIAAIFLWLETFNAKK